MEGRRDREQSARSKSARLCTVAKKKSRIFREVSCGNFPWKLKDTSLRKKIPQNFALGDYNQSL